MIKVKKEGVLIQKTDNNFENEGVLNPAVIHNNNHINLFYRAVENGNYSSIGYCKLNTPLTIQERMMKPLLIPEFEYESHGIEDPRITQIDDTFYLTYTAYDGVNALGALAISTDLEHFKKLGIITPKITYQEFNRLTKHNHHINEKYLRYNEHGGLQEKDGKKVLVWDKNIVFFPKRINGKLYFLHRIRPDIQIVAVNNLQDLNAGFWQHYFWHLEDNIVLSPQYKHEVSYIGAGCPPIETIHGWLLIYHGVHDTVNGYVYSACAALLDLQNPQQEIARLPYPLFKPELDWETKGEVNNVCFPTGAVLISDTLYIYYGAADERIACASMSISALLEELLINKKQEVI